MILKYIKKINKYLHKIDYIIQSLAIINTNINYLRESLGRIESRQNRFRKFNKLYEYEFKVYSQWGEDGIIDFLVESLDVKNKVFVEFGVENYKESNTRFLLVNRNWSGLVIDCNEENINYIKNDSIYWKYNIKAVCEFITRDNINNILKNNGIKGNIGLLSIDIDGNDYWIWKPIDIINPDIVVVEYNSRFDSEKAVTIPYHENFSRAKAHYSMIYYGASLKALCLLGSKKGYTFVGCNSLGNNAFFVLSDLINDSIKELSLEGGFVAGKFRESRNLNGELAYLSFEEEKKILESLPLIEVD